MEVKCYVDGDYNRKVLKEPVIPCATLYPRPEQKNSIPIS